MQGNHAEMSGELTWQGKRTLGRNRTPPDPQRPPARTLQLRREVQPQLRAVPEEEVALQGADEELLLQAIEDLLAVKQEFSQI